MAAESICVSPDVIILGSGLAGLTLARQLLMYSDKTVLLLEQQARLSPDSKPGDSTVQVQGYYLSKMLDLEEHLLRDHFLNYNLRFYWPPVAEAGADYENYSQSYVKLQSNIGCYHVDRNRIEEELLKLNLQRPAFSFQPGISNLEVSLSTGSGPHFVSFEVEQRKVQVNSPWVVDTTGRSRFLAGGLELAKPKLDRYASISFWVEGLLNIEKLTGLDHRSLLLHENRRRLGHMPAWLATSHFCGEGYWFRVISLHGKTSLGLVYERGKVNEEEVSSPEKVIAWLCKRHPLFARDLPNRKIIGWRTDSDFPYDCTQVISANRWALSGAAARVGDPLYNSGGDLIALYNTLIADAILTSDGQAVTIKARLYDLLMWAVYEAYIPGSAVTYEVMADQECFVMKYCWELTIYFTFYVFPFLNQMFTDSSFVVPYLDLFAKLGPLNNSLQPFIAAYYRWKQSRSEEPCPPALFDFTSLEPLKKSEELFYKVGLSARECIRVLRYAMLNIENLARFVAVYIYSVVLDNEDLLTNKQLIQSLDLTNLTFDPTAMAAECESLVPERDTRLEKLGGDFTRQFRQLQHRGHKVKNKITPMTAL